MKSVLCCLWLAVLPVSANSASADAVTSSSDPGSSAPAFAVQPGEMKLILQAYQALPAEVDRAAYDLQARAATLGPAPQAAFEFVRDQIAGEPYPGVLRGAAGTLSAGAGNDLDKALLLAALLAEGGHQVRYAHCVLPADDAGRLVRGYLAHRPPAAATDAALSAALGKALEQQGLASARSAEIVTSQGRIRDWLDAAVQQTATADLSLVRDTLDRAGIRPTPVDPTTAVIDEARQHYWVQFRAGDNWQDVDTSLPASFDVPSLCDATTTFDTLPPDLFQAITINVRNETLADGVLSPAIVLSERLLVSEHYGDVLLLFNDMSTQGSLLGGESDRLVPTLVVGKDLRRGQEYELMAGSQSAGFDPFGSALSGGDDPPRIVAQWLELTFEAPGRSTSTTRTLFDTVPPSERAQGSIASRPSPEAVRMLLASQFALAITAGPVNSVAAMEARFAGLDAKLIGRVFDSKGNLGKITPEELSGVVPQLLSLYALDFALASERALVRMDSAAGQLRLGRDQPMVTIAGSEFNLGPGDAVDLHTSLDLRHDEIRVVPDGPHNVETAYWLNTRHGLVDAALEHHLPMIAGAGEPSTSLARFDTSTAIAGARAQGIDLRGAVGADAIGLLQGGELADAGGLRLAAEVHDGIAIVVPVRPPILDQAPWLGLWTVDLNTGQLYAVGDGGLHVIIVEYDTLVKAISAASVALATCLRLPGRNCEALVVNLAVLCQQLLIQTLARGL